MITVLAGAEPAYFEKEIREPGNKWLAKNPNAKRPRDFWARCLPELGEIFVNRCGYAAMLDPTGGTVDHYKSFKNHRELAYEWKNYRFASAVMNASKRTADTDVLDPHEVGKGWFEILLPSLQMRVADAVPQEFRARAEFTLKRLNLRDGERIIQWRQSWYDMYLSQEMNLEGLRRVAPLIAEAVEREAAVEG
jgi:hypothetical protein